MDEYYYIYKNSFKEWDVCKNPKFIARHTFCRAIPKDLKKFGFEDLRECRIWLNTIDEQYLEALTEAQQEFIKDWIW